MNASATQGFLFPNITANISMQPTGINTQILLLQILHLTQQFSQTHNTLIEQHLNLFNHSQDSQQEFDKIKKRLEESDCEANTIFDQFQQMRLEIQDKNNTINIQRQTIEDLQVQVQNYSQLVESIQDEVDSKTTINENLNNKVLDLQQQLENKNIQHENISSELLECKIKSNTKTTIIHDPADCIVDQTNQLKSIWTKFEVCEQQKERMLKNKNDDIKALNREMQQKSYQCQQEMQQKSYQCQQEKNKMETEQKQLKILADEAENIRKKQALNKAVAENNLEKVKILLEAGVSTETVDNNGYSPLFNASQYGYLEIVKLLVQYGANLYARSENRFGSSCIHAAASNGRKEVLQFLLDKGVPVDIRNKYGQTALGSVAWTGQYDTAKMLIQRGANVNDHITNLDLRTPLHSAAHQGHVKLVELLLDHGADINALEEENETALHWAARKGRLEVAKFLVKRGINVNLKNKSGNTAKQIATLNNFTDVANYLASV